jgi:hypothetical protein
MEKITLNDKFEEFDYLKLYLKETKIDCKKFNNSLDKSIQEYTSFLA